MTDAELVRRTREGESLAREQLVRRWSPRILAVCRARICRHDAAEDLAQETLIRGLAHLEQLEEAHKLGAWLRGIAVNVCLDWLRARPRNQVPFSVVAGHGDAQPFERSESGNHHLANIEQQERQQQLKAEIDALPDELREPLLLFYYDDITYEQIAELLGVSRATVNARLAKARQQLSRRLAHLAK